MNTKIDSAKTAYANNFGQAYANSLISLGESLVQTLKQFNCTRVYGVGGDFAANIITALDKKIKLSPCSNELHAAFSACGQAELSGIGFCLTTYTVGSLPCATAIALAKAEQLPVVFISGAPGEDEVEGTAIHHSVVSSSSWAKNFDLALNAYKSMGIRAERLQGERNSGQPNVAGVHFYNLVQHAIDHKEPVFVEIPRDLLSTLTQPIKYDNEHLGAAHAGNTIHSFSLEGSHLIAQQIALKLNTAKQPLFFIGEKIKLNKPLLGTIYNFCNQHNIPYATSWFGKGILDESNPLSLGAYNGIFSSQTALDFIEDKVDYVLEIGTSIYPQDTNVAFDTGTHQILHFENKTVLKGSEVNDSDIASVFSELTKLDIKQYSAPVELINSLVGKSLNAEDTLGFHNISNTLNDIQEKTEPAFVYFPEIGNSFFSSFQLKTKQSELGRSWVTNPWYAAMGTSLCYAKVASQMVKDSQGTDIPLVITGDGGFHFQSNELIHILRDNLSVVILYMRNNIFHLGKNGDADIYNCSTADFNVISLVEAYGGTGQRCTTVGELTESLAEICKRDFIGLNLIEIPVSTEQEFSCREIKLLNLYIRASNGDIKAEAEWMKLTSRN